MNRLLSLIVLGCFAAALGCTAGVKKPSAGGPGAGGTSGTTGSGGSGTTPPPPVCNGMCTDFPAEPRTDGDPPANAPQLFGDAGGGSASGGPCLVEPQVGALYPNNWLRPRFRVIPAAGQDL